MKEARASTIWHRAGPVTAFGLVLFAAAINQGCSDDTSPSQTSSTTTTTTSTTSTSSGMGGMGGEGGMGQGGGSAGLQAESCSTDGVFNSPFDATPDPDGNVFYFTAVDVASGDAGIFTGCTPVAALHVGDPLVAPLGIATSTDGAKLWVTDPGAEDSNGALGAVFTLGTSPGTPVVVAGTEGTVPRGLDLVGSATGDIVYFTGVDPSDKQPGLFMIKGGVVSTVAKGSPFVDPSGVAVASNGTIYVSDTDGSGNHLGAIVQVSNGTATLFVTNVGVGYPAGISITKDDSTVLLSGIDPSTSKDVVYLVNATTKEISTFTDTIGENLEAAGLHRAHNVDVYAWADLSAGVNGGTVYKVSFK